MMMYLFGMRSATFLRGAREALTAAMQIHKRMKVFMMRDSVINTQHLDANKLLMFNMHYAKQIHSYDTAKLYQWCSCKELPVSTSWQNEIDITVFVK